jgi:mannosyl-oligosaccharide alpha-1,3-glucosidase
VRVERVIVVNAPKEWESKSEVLVLADGAKTGTKAGLTWHGHHSGKADWLVVRDPGVGIGTDWKIDFS